MDENRYWEIIEESLIYSKGNEDMQIDHIQYVLENSSTDDVILFYYHSRNLIKAINTNEMWCAFAIMNEDFSDELFQDFRYWVVSQGKDVYYNAKENPDTLVCVANRKDREYGFEEFGQIPFEVYNLLTEEDLSVYLNNFYEEEDLNALLELVLINNITFTWDVNDPGTMINICPNLYHKFFN